jgi:hypothetical protein
MIEGFPLALLIAEMTFIYVIAVMAAPALTSSKASS